MSRVPVTAERGMIVHFEEAKNDLGQPAEAGRGLILDRAPGVGWWWVMPNGATRAVMVNVRHMSQPVVER